ncbi:Hypothetical predicted protein [Xyrichtys novacula]|uniref:Uncharacterized protein n=1 Tax=Xyrichtys novacula TaxID=13765 RepID=A0AAV1G6V9_XYRNO|nr:Hypothetical predicted protein [Xyrichtys novacula]
MDRMLTAEEVVTTEGRRQAHWRPVKASLEAFQTSLLHLSTRELSGKSSFSARAGFSTQTTWRVSERRGKGAQGGRDISALCNTSHDRWTNHKTCQQHQRGGRAMFLAKLQGRGLHLPNGGTREAEGPAALHLHVSDHGGPNHQRGGGTPVLGACYLLAGGTVVAGSRSSGRCSSTEVPGWGLWFVWRCGLPIALGYQPIMDVVGLVLGALVVAAAIAEQDVEERSGWSHRAGERYVQLDGWKETRHPQEESHAGSGYQTCSPAAGPEVEQEGSLGLMGIDVAGVAVASSSVERRSSVELEGGGGCQCFGPGSPEVTMGKGSCIRRGPGGDRSMAGWCCCWCPPSSSLLRRRP